MLMSSKLSQTIFPVLDRSKLSDIAPVFNLIQDGSLNGHFSNLYTQPRYMAGLGIQLFWLWKYSKIKLPDGSCHHANMKVLRIGREFAGFTILRHEGKRPNEIEIYMCSLQNDSRGKGLGEWMLRAALSDIPTGYMAFADCLPDSAQMKSLLGKLGFTEAAIGSPCEMAQLARRFVWKQDDMTLRE